MRVLHVTAYFAPAFSYGGPPRSILGLCKALQRVGVQVSVFTTTANGERDFEPSTDRTTNYETVPVQYFARTFPKRFFRATELARVLPKAFNSYDLLHLHGLWNFAVWTAAKEAQRRGIPYIISPRGMLDFGSISHKPWRKRLAYDFLERNNLNGADRLHASSAAEAITLAGYGFGEKVFTLPLGVDMPPETPETSTVLRRRLRLTDGAKLIVFLGRIHPTKRLDLLADAFFKVRSALRNVHLIVAGPNENNYRQQIEPYFDQTRESVHWLGELGEEKWALLRAADVLVMCSDSESFGASVAEAMSVGLPVVVTQTCPWKEIETARCGFWVTQDSSAIADALIAVLDNPAEAVAMGERGQKLSTAKYGWDSIAGQMASHYQQVLNARHS